MFETWGEAVHFQKHNECNHFWQSCRALTLCFTPLLRSPLARLCFPTPEYKATKMKSSILLTIVASYISCTNAAACFSAGHLQNGCQEPQSWSWTCVPSKGDPPMAKGPPKNACTYKATQGSSYKQYCCAEDGPYSIE
ncbi:unnamed protein product [Cercospora beticola]|nr:unnamed protein product [Cercospora beticola]